MLNLSRPDIVREIHRGYLEAGSDVIQTNSFGGSPITLAEFDGLSDRAHEVNQRAVEQKRLAGQLVERGRIDPGVAVCAYVARVQPVDNQTDGIHAGFVANGMNMR